MMPAILQLDGGYEVRSLEKLPVQGADFGFAVGARPQQHFALYGALRLFAGSTEDGLLVRSGRIGCGLAWIPFDRFRVFVEPALFSVWVGRVTFDQTIVSGGVSLGAGVRFDVVRDSTYALFLRVAGEAGPAFGDGSLVASATFGVGVDFYLP